MLRIERASSIPPFQLVIAASCINVTSEKAFCASPRLFSAKVASHDGLCSATTGTMVRLKNRYLLVNILYPELEKGQSNSKIPDVVVFNQPTTNDLTASALMRGIRAEVSSLFGDYGMGSVSESLAGKTKLGIVECRLLKIYIQSNTFPQPLQPSFSVFLVHTIRSLGRHCR